MFVDARRLDNDATIEADVCIIGGGVAGITLALEFGKGASEPAFWRAVGSARTLQPEI